MAKNRPKLTKTIKSKNTKATIISKTKKNLVVDL
jgi:hypothetical protein